MIYENLKKEVNEIAEIAGKVPEQFREKCFEILLTHLLNSLPHPAKAAAAHPNNPSPGTGTPTQTPQQGNSLTLPASLKAFMRRTGITQAEIEAVVMLEDGEFHFIKEPSHSNVSKGQNEWALLLALKNGVLSGNLSVDAEAVRSIVQEKGFYDRANFAANFKSAKYASWFKEALEAQGPSINLSAEGEKVLAALIKAL